MSHAFHQLYFHITWTTKDRAPVISESSRHWFLTNLRQQSQQRGATVLACNVIPDHVHLFVTLPPTILLSTFIGQVKGSLTHTYNKAFQPDADLHWQKGYGAITVRAAEAEKVCRYVENQQSLHANRKAYRLLETSEPEEPTDSEDPPSNR